MNLRKKFAVNLSYAFAAQIIVLIVSLIANFTLPKFLNEEQFSYWQLFIFYSQYMAFLHLGLNDGIYLRYGGQRYEELDKGIIKAQLLLGIGYQMLLTLLLSMGAVCYLNDRDRIYVIILNCINFLLYTIQNYICFVFQAVNETAWYSRANIINRIVFFSFMILAFIWNEERYAIYILILVLAQLTSTIYSVIKGREIFAARVPEWKTAFRELGKSISIGGKLLLANIASMLILGIGRQCIDLQWGVVVFGKVSFALTLTNFFLVFVQQISMVMFPMLRQLEENQKKNIYTLVQQGLFLGLPIIMIAFFPMRIILQIWLPNYTESLRYLGILLPICFFEIKVQLLFNTYLKVLRKEKILLRVNMIAMLFSLLFCSVATFVVKSLLLAMISMVFVIALRSIILEKNMIQNGYSRKKWELFQEMVLATVFVLVAWNLSNIWGSFVFSIVYILFLVRNRNIVKVFMLNFSAMR